MRRPVLFAALAALILAAGPSAAEWKMNEFMIFCFGSFHKADNPDARVKALAEAGFTVLDGSKDQLDTCYKHGVRLMVSDVPPEQVASVRNHPALWGYHIIDEPLHNLPALKKLHDAYRAGDPDHCDYSNLISLGGEYLSSYMEVIRPRILSYDFYQYWWGQNGHFAKLELYRRAALDAGVPMVLYYEVDSHSGALWGWGPDGPKYRPDNRQRLRMGVYTGLTYGLKGIEWFWTGAIFKPGTSELTPAGRDVAAINAELKTLGPVLMKLQSVDVFHTEPLPRDAKAIPAEHWIQVTNYGAPGLVLGAFRDGQGIEYAMVSNSNWEDGQLVAMEIRRKFPLAKVERFDRKTGSWVNMPVTDILSEKSRKKIAQAYDYYMYSQRDGGDNITYADINEKWTQAQPGKQLVEFELAPGDGELFRFTRNLDFKTIRQEGKKY